MFSDISLFWFYSAFISLLSSCYTVETQQRLNGIYLHSYKGSESSGAFKDFADPKADLFWLKRSSWALLSENVQMKSANCYENDMN